MLKRCSTCSLFSSHAFCTIFCAQIRRASKCKRKPIKARARTLTFHGPWILRLHTILSFLSSPQHERTHTKTQTIRKYAKREESKWAFSIMITVGSLTKSSHSSRMSRIATDFIEGTSSATRSITLNSTTLGWPTRPNALPISRPINSRKGYRKRKARRKRNDLATPQLHLAWRRSKRFRKRGMYTATREIHTVSRVNVKNKILRPP